MLTLTILGTSAALPSAGRFNVAFYVQNREMSFLLETGPNILHQLQMAGIDSCHLRYLFISHMHGDHVLGFPMLLLHRFFNNCTDPLRVICLDTVKESLEQMVNSVYPEISSDFNKHCTFIPYPSDSMRSTEIEPGFRVSTLPAVHGVPTLAIRLDWPDRSITYSADTAPSPDMSMFASESDVLIHDANFSAVLDPSIKLKDHSTARAAAEIAQNAKVKILVLVHMNKKYRGQESIFYQEASSVFSGQILVPTHLSTLVI